MSNEDVDVYTLLNRGNIGIFTNTPSMYYPILTPTEYGVGQFNRYFVRSANDKNANIIEIDEAEYRSFQKNPFYIKTSISWKIKGPIEDIIKDGILLESGVSKHNFEQLTLAESNFPGLIEKLTDLFEFYKAD